MRLISRNVLREILPPFGLGLAAYTFLLLLRSLVQLSEMVIRRGAPASLVLRLLLLTLPQVLVLTIPMAFLFGVLIGIGRLSGDSEIVALRASGVSRWTLFRPVGMAGAALALLVAFLSMWGYPTANDRLERLENRLFASAALEMVRPRVFTEPRTEWEWIMFVDRDAAGTAGWRGVFLDDRTDPARESVIVAREGRFRFDGNRLWLDLVDAIQHTTERMDPRTYHVDRSDRLSILVHESPAANVAGHVEKGVRLQTLAELLANLRRPAASPERYRLLEVEVHKKFAIPAACLAFALVGLPLGITNRRGGKGSGFAISLVIILGYYLLFNTGENWAEDGRLSPALAMWLPNALLFLFGAFLFLRPERERLGWFQRWRLRRGGREARPRPQAAVANAGSGLAGFPTRLDRYVLSPFLAALAAIYASVTFLYVLVDYSDHADDILKRRIPPEVVVDYYRAMLAPILVQILPFCVMLAALVALGALSRHGEDTAFRACGVPLARLGVPIVAVAVLASAGAFWTGEYVLPGANRESHRLLDRIKGRTQRAAAMPTGGAWVLGGDGARIWNYDTYEPGARRLWRPSLFEFDRDFRLVARTTAATAEWDGAGWRFRDGWRRTFSGAAETSFSPFGTLPVTADVPRLFERTGGHPDEMRYRALARYVEHLARSGYPVAELATALASKPAAAAQTIVLACLAVPFAFTVGKRGALTGIGVGLAAGMLFLVLASLFTRLGEVGSVPPILAAWGPNMIFVLFAAYRMTTVRT
ncbi:MAG TPA: LPS export ABC transporter permease LptF [Thermoanaerobaculia bacterium]|nr:LPS export ABC transporter permease LptF [Thermoanaerobaculia bacterium]